MAIRWNEPVFGDEEISSVSDVLKSGFVTEGPKSKELIEKLKSFLGVKYVVLTTSGTAALFLAMESDRIIRGLNDYEVLVPNVTFIATASSVELAMGKPVLVDVNPDDFCININDLRKKITPKTKSIIPVHILGRACNLKEIEEIAEENNLTIIEDAAGAFGSKEPRGYLGTFGKVGCFSMQANKIISSGHGGFLVTNDDKYYEVITRIKNFGRFDPSEEAHLITGYNFKFNDILAAVALEQFKKLGVRIEKFIAQRKRYVENLKDVEEVKFPSMNYDVGEVPIYVDAIVQKREKLINHLESKGIYPRKCWLPLHRNPPYSDQGSNANFPISSFVSDNCLWFPNGNNISLKEIDLICNEIKNFYSKVFHK